MNTVAETPQQADLRQQVNFNPNVWVVSKDWDKIARIKNVHVEKNAIVALDLVFFNRNGDRLGRVSPALGGPVSYEPCCGADQWIAIREPAFPLPKYDPLFRVIKFMDDKDIPEDDNRL